MNQKQSRLEVAKLLAQAANNINIDSSTGLTADRDYNMTKMSGYLEVADRLGMRPELIYGDESAPAIVTGAKLGGEEFTFRNGEVG